MPRGDTSLMQAQTNKYVHAYIHVHTAIKSFIA